MADSYYGYGAPTDRGSVPRTIFPGYYSEPGPSLASHYLGSSASADFLHNNYQTNQMGIGLHSEYGFGGSSAGPSIGYPSLEDPNLLSQRRDAALGISPGIPDIHHERPGSVRNVDNQINQMGIGVHLKYGFGGSSAAPGRGYPSLEDPNLLSQRRDAVLGITPGVPDILNERPSSVRNVDDLPSPLGKSTMLFVDGLPTDCTRREVGHLFRPFIGFKEIRLVHKEPRHSGDKAMVLCFIEFVDSTCALTAMEALQGYKFDDKKPDSQSLKIQFAHFPFRLPSDRDEKK